MKILKIAKVIMLAGAVTLVSARVVLLVISFFNNSDMIDIIDDISRWPTYICLWSTAILTFIEKKLKDSKEK